jgi:hypothetical protein
MVEGTAIKCIRYMALINTYYSVEAEITPPGLIKTEE